MAELEDEYPFGKPSTWDRGIFTCETTGCEYFGVRNAFRVPVSVMTANVVCGGCNYPITSRVLAGPDTQDGIQETTND